MATWQLIYYIGEWVIRVVMLIYVPQKRSSRGAGWLLMIFLLPWPGLLLYAIIGRPYFPSAMLACRRRCRRMAAMNKCTATASGSNDARSAAPNFHVVKLAQNLGDFRFSPAIPSETIDDYNYAIDKSSPISIRPPIMPICSSIFSPTTDRQ